MAVRLRALLDRVIIAGLAVGALLSLLGLLGGQVAVFDLVNHFQLPILLLACGAMALSFVWPYHFQSFKRIGQGLIAIPLTCSLLLLGSEFVKRYSPTLFESARASNDLRPLKFMSFNVYLGTWDGAGLARTINRQAPELVALQEYAPNRFKRQPDLKSAYPYQARCKNWRACTLAILSKHRLSDIQSHDVGGGNQRNPMHGKVLAATVHVKGSKPVRLYNVHLTWPLPLSEKQTQLNNLADIVKSEAKRYPQQIIAGDFNSTGWAFRVDRFSRGLGFDRVTHLLPTFPSPNSRIKRLRLPAFLSLDHILVGEGITAGRIVRVSSPVGDHWPIFGELYLPK